MSGNVSLVNGHIDPDTSRVTNYEKIKAMSVDEMADSIIKETSHCDFCSRKNSPTCVAVEGGCKKYIKMYLESEVEEE